MTSNVIPGALTWQVHEMLLELSIVAWGRERAGAAPALDGGAVPPPASAHEAAGEEHDAARVSDSFSGSDSYSDSYSDCYSGCYPDLRGLPTRAVFARGTVRLDDLLAALLHRAAPDARPAGIRARQAAVMSHVRKAVAGERVQLFVRRIWAHRAQWGALLRKVLASPLRSAAARAPRAQPAFARPSAAPPNGPCPCRR